MFASKCLGATLCHDGCSLRSRGSWLGGSLVSALSFVASAPSEVALCVFVVGCFVCFLGQGPALTWHRSCHLHASRCKMACAKDGTQAAIGIHLKSTLLSICPVFFWCCFVCFVVFCVFCFLWFLFCLLSCWFVLALGNWIVYGLCKGPHLLSFVAFFTDGFACISIQFPAS